MLIQLLPRRELNDSYVCKFDLNLLLFMLYQKPCTQRKLRGKKVDLTHGNLREMPEVERIHLILTKLATTSLADCKARKSELPRGSKF